MERKEPSLSWVKHKQWRASLSLCMLKRLVSAFLHVCYAAWRQREHHYINSSFWRNHVIDFIPLGGKIWEWWLEGEKKGRKCLLEKCTLSNSWHRTECHVYKTHFYLFKQWHKCTDAFQIKHLKCQMITQGLYCLIPIPTSVFAKSYCAMFLLKALT